jgi:tetratricopeptide (TPR) repeat protein
MDWGAWSQGAESKSPDGDAPSAGQVSRSDEPPAPDSLSRQEPLRGAEGGGRALEEAPQPVEAGAVPVLVSDAGESTSELPGRRHPSRPGFDQMAGALPRERRKLLLPAAGLALLVALGWLVTRAGSSASKSARSSGLAAPTASVARAASAVSAIPGAADAAAAQAAGPLAVGPTPAPDAAPARAEPARTAEREDTSRAQVAANGTPSRADDGGQVRRPAPAPLGENELLGRCRRVDAGGKGKPALVLAACEPASEAEPTAADILVILARAELDRGNALEARSWAKKAVAVSPDLGDAYVFLGGAEQELGNPADAKAAYRKYLELAPNGRYARELRAVLDGL